MPSPTFAPPPGFQLNDFADIVIGGVSKLIRSAPLNQSFLDPLPTWLLKECAEIISPFIASLCNASMKSGQVPKALKEAYITPLLKKPTLDSNDINNCRPISNLSVLSKLLEKVVCKQQVVIQTPTILCHEINWFIIGTTRLSRHWRKFSHTLCQQLIMATSFYYHSWTYRRLSTALIMRFY